VATKKDLVEAYSYSRRRLVTAFVSGAPGGREVEPARPGRTVVGGLALAVLLVAGAAIASVLASRTEEDWNQVGLVVSREDAAPYVILKKEDPPTLIPVINITSAQLILGATVEPKYVDQSVIENQTPGDTIGIAGAPQTLPRPRQFVETGWTACTGSYQDTPLGLQVDVSTSTKVSVPAAGGVLVSNGGQDWLVARSGPADEGPRRAYRYLLPQGLQSEAMMTGLGLRSTAQATPVPQEWLGLFPQGGTLEQDSFAVADFGKPLKGKGVPDGARVGDYYLNPDQKSGFYLTADAKAVPLDPFSLQVYVNSAMPGHADRFPHKLAIDQPTFPSLVPSYGDAHWPGSTLDPVLGQVCARLDAGHAREPRVDLAADPHDGAQAPDSLAADQKQLTIDPGHGAFVRSGGWGDTSSTSAYVIDPRGLAYALVGADSVHNLGYDTVKESFVPDAWLKLFDPGVALSTSKALCPPDQAAAVAPASPAPSASASASSAPNPNGCQDFATQGSQ
jgi:type VII secretion protein EccB